MKEVVRTDEELVYKDEIQERVSENYSPYSYVEETDAKYYDQKELMEFDWTKEP